MMKSSDLHSRGSNRIGANSSSSNGHNTISISASTGTVGVSPDHGIDHYDAKYDRDRRLKRRLRGRKIKQGGATTWCLPSLSAGILILISFSLATICMHYLGNVRSKKQRQKVERLQRAENVWKQRQQQEFDGVALHMAGVSVHELQEQFAELRKFANEPRITSKIRELLQTWLEQEELDIRHNMGQASPCWIRPYLLPPHPESAEFKAGTAQDDQEGRPAAAALAAKSFRLGGASGKKKIENLADFFRVHRGNRDKVLGTMAWREDYDKLVEQHGNNDKIPGPSVDYTVKSKYTYPELLEQPPADGAYPKLQPLGDLLYQWPQDQDFVGTFHETLQHFNYSDPVQLQMAKRFRDAEVPFKVYGVPDIDEAGSKWTDEYVGTMFGDHMAGMYGGNVKLNDVEIPVAKGTAQESRTNYFAFFVAKAWDVESMGLAPTRNNDWSYDTWAEHAVYADAVSLSADRPHFYWQSGVPPEERHKAKSKWCFISRDLPSFSSEQDNFFVFHVQEQKGIQCRFGERGVVAATHFDGGRNMVAMVKGAKRYILSPPNQCSKLGLFTQKRSPIYRHSLLNFGHIEYLRNNETVTGMSKEERAWLERAATSQTVETVLKQGEVLYIPSHWFHYIVSLQKSAQCNVRSGIDVEGTLQFGGRKEVEECVD